MENKVDNEIHCWKHRSPFWTWWAARRIFYRSSNYFLWYLSIRWLLELILVFIFKNTKEKYIYIKYKIHKIWKYIKSAAMNIYWAAKYINSIDNQTNIMSKSPWITIFLLVENTFTIYFSLYLTFNALQFIIFSLGIYYLYHIFPLASWSSAFGKSKTKSSLIPWTLKPK